MSLIKSTTLQFLADIKENNNKPWFEANKDRYEAAKEDMTDFIAGLVTQIKKVEPVLEKPAKKYVGRIYRDLRFSKDKSPYHTYLSSLIERGTDGKKCPFYIHIEPGNCFVGGGVWQPDPELLKKVRQEIDYNSSDFNKIIKNATFKKYFGELSGDKLIRAPKGYEEDNPNIELLKLKQYVVHKHFSEEEVTSVSFASDVLDVYHAALNFFTFFDQSKQG
jgi:uncharacterized protein (TIGR02453 family)